MREEQVIARAGSRLRAHPLKVERLSCVINFPPKERINPETEAAKYPVCPYKNT